MRRRSTRTLWQSRFYDIRKDLAPEQLEGIGAIMLAWNDIEGRLDQILATAIGLPGSIALEVTSRINGLDGKFEIIRKSAQHHLQFSKEIYETIAKTLNDLEQRYKKYRDGIAHAWILHPQEVVAPSGRQRGKLYEVLVSVDALNTLYDHLAVLQSEIGAVSSVIFVKTRLMRQEVIPPVDPMLRLTERELQGYVEILRDYQRQRQALPPLPEFPPESEDPLTTEEPQAPGP
jgi:hypothetical protein